jgi:hypothetical protein
VIQVKILNVVEPKNNPCPSANFCAMKQVRLAYEDVGNSVVDAVSPLCVRADAGNESSDWTFFSVVR